MGEPRTHAVHEPPIQRRTRGNLAYPTIKALSAVSRRPTRQEHRQASAAAAMDVSWRHTPAQKIDPLEQQSPVIKADYGLSDITPEDPLLIRAMRPVSNIDRYIKAQRCPRCRVPFTRPSLLMRSEEQVGSCCACKGKGWLETPDVLKDRALSGPMPMDTRTAVKIQCPVCQASGLWPYLTGFWCFGWGENQHVSSGDDDRPGRFWCKAIVLRVL